MFGAIPVKPDDVGTVTVIEDFISPGEETELLQHIEAALPIVNAPKNHVQRNIVQRWGSSVPYYTSVVSPIIPDYFQFLFDRLVAHAHVPMRPDSITLNQYLKKQAILAHIDDPKAGSVITVLSLLTPATMVFRQEQREFSVDLPPRSLVQMRDEIRYNWTHEILPVTAKRYSLVFRNSQEK